MSLKLQFQKIVAFFRNTILKKIQLNNLPHLFAKPNPKFK